MTKPKTTKPASPWVSLGHETPTPGDNVLVCGCARSGAPFVAWINHYGKWRGHGVDPDAEPTHWMPIPPLPEGER